MEMNRKALYNSLRMNWVLDPTIDVEAWQVEDYRSMPIDGLFERLEDMDIRMDKGSFIAFAGSMDTPEELAETLALEDDADEKLSTRSTCWCSSCGAGLSPKNLLSRCSAMRSITRSICTTREKTPLLSLCPMCWLICR